MNKEIDITAKKEEGQLLAKAPLYGRKQKKTQVTTVTLSEIKSEADSREEASGFTQVKIPALRIEEVDQHMMILDGRNKHTERTKMQSKPLHCFMDQMVAKKQSKTPTAIT